MEMDKVENNTGQSRSLTEWLPRLKIKSNGLRRTITGLSLVAYFIFVVYVGLPLIISQALLIEIVCYNEIINIAYNAKKMPEIPYFRVLNWYFVITANYFFFGETFGEYLEAYTKNYYIFEVFMTYHRFLSFCWYFMGIIWFVTLVRKRIIRQQFSLLAWTHFLLIIIVLQTYMVVQNIFQGLIWLIIPLCLVILNDIFAYVCGRMLGKTPLISLSPNKTLEGFIYGGICTFILGSVLSYAFCHIPYLVCPIRYVETENGILLSTNCTPSYLFQPIYYNIANTGLRIKSFPFMIHSLAFSFFASIIAPFGGFYASGFKRAFKVKDFSDLIPGHGGLTDRFDCQFLMATFVNVYISTFIKTPQVESFLRKILLLSETNQLKFFHLLNQSLHTRGILEELNN